MENRDELWTSNPSETHHTIAKFPIPTSTTDICPWFGLVNQVGLQLLPGRHHGAIQRPPQAIHQNCLDQQASRGVRGFQARDYRADPLTKVAPHALLLTGASLRSGSGCFNATAHATNESYFAARRAGGSLLSGLGSLMRPSLDMQPLIWHLPSASPVTIVDHLGLSVADRGDAGKIVTAIQSYVAGQINESAERRNFRSRTRVLR